MTVAEHDDNLDTLTCAWCDLSQLGWAQSAGDGRQYPSCGEVGHGIQFAPDAQIVDDLRAALASVRAALDAERAKNTEVLDLLVAEIDKMRPANEVSDWTQYAHDLNGWCDEIGRRAARILGGKD